MSTGIPFGNYHLCRRLARGGMAEVFLATQRGPAGFERTVAVKRILPHLADTSQFLDMFMDEARLAAQLSHSNIAHIYEFGSVNDSYFIAMEYIDGVDLSAVILEGARRPLPLEHAARIIADLAAALHYAHQLKDRDGKLVNLVHRDISPQNILVSFDGMVKVVDFGIAKAAHHIERTSPGVVRGKYSYMSPEQVRGKPLDRRSDLFSAGIVMYELCTGEALFPRANAVQAMQLIRSAEIPRPMRRGTPLPEGLSHIISRSLARKREDRYQTAGEMQMDLEEYLKSTREISNSILLGEYFTTHYRSIRPEPVVATQSAPGTKKASVPFDGTMDISDGSVEVMSEPIIQTMPTVQERPEADPISRASGIIHSQPTDLRTISLSESPPLERTQSISSADLQPVHIDESYPGEGDVDLDSATVEIQTGPAHRVEDPADSAPTFYKTGESTGAKPAQAGTTLSLRPIRRRLILFIGICIIGAFAVTMGIWVATSGDTLDTPAPAPTALILPDTARAKPSNTILSIASTPTGSGVKIDDRAISGITPLSHAISPGPHTILLSKPGYEDKHQKIFIERGQVLKLVLALRTSPAATPDQGTPAPRPKPVAEIRRPRRRTGVKTTRISRPEPRPKPAPSRVPTARSFGFLSITTIPWSAVFLNGKKIGITPLANVRVPSGRHKVRLTNPQRRAVKRTVTIHPDRVTKLRIKL